MKLKITIITTLNLVQALVISRRWAELFREKNAESEGGYVGQKAFLNKIQSTLSKTDTIGTGLSCPS